MAGDASSAPQKAVLISEASGDALRSHLAKLELVRRALSLPVTPDPPAALPSFVELWGGGSELRAVVASWPHPARAWLVAEHVPVAYRRSWPSGEASPGLRLVSTVHRRPGLDRAAFAAHWCGPHVRIATSYSVPVWHYVQNLVVEPLGHASDVDGFVGMHFRKAEDLRARWQDHPQEAARGAEDAARFMDVARSVSIAAIETVWVDEVGRS